MCPCNAIAGICVMLLTAGASAPVATAADIHAAAAAGDVERVELLLRDKPKLIDVADESGNAPLHLAARNLRVEVVDHLLTAGADLHTPDATGATALHLAILSGLNAKEASARRDALTELLLARGAQVQSKDKQGKTPLHLAAIKGRVSVLDQLHKAKADLTAKDRIGRTPLHDAALYNHLPVIEWLAARGVDVSAADNQGDTPLHAAALRFRKEAAELLIAKGADVNAKNMRGETPLHITGSAGPEEIEVDRLEAAVADVLLMHGADVNALDKRGLTPLDHALAKSRSKLAEVIRRHGGQSR